MQDSLYFGQADDLQAIRDRLVTRFGRIRIADRPDPISQFVGSMLGSRTYDRVSSNAFIRLVTHFRTWDAIADAPEVEQALCWLERIHGVGRKISAATLNFNSLRGRAFVVDTHVLRILRRFGFVEENTSSEHAYEAVMAAADTFDAGDLFELHWLLKGLGQKTCTHARAFCLSCPLADICRRRVEGGAIAANVSSVDAA